MSSEDLLSNYFQKRKFLLLYRYILIISYVCLDIVKKSDTAKRRKLDVLEDAWEAAVDFVEGAAEDTAEHLIYVGGNLSTF